MKKNTQTTKIHLYVGAHLHTNNGNGGNIVLSKAWLITNIGL